MSENYPVLTATALKAAIADGAELAILDAREEGQFGQKHLFFANCVPYGRIETLIDRLVPRRSARIVVTDGAGEIAPRAAAKLARLGYGNVSVLEGGTAAWERAGFEVYSGVHVPSKAFGEAVHAAWHPPEISSAELQSWLDQPEKLIVIDSRPFEEYQNRSIPGAIDCPGAELIYRIGELVPDPETSIVINCGGRTRGIIGAQTLIAAGVPNRVRVLDGGLQEWILSGFEPRHGASGYAPQPSPENLAVAQARARRLAEAAGVTRIDSERLAWFEAERENRTLYKLDIRGPEEYAAGHLPDWRHAPGGQLLQATDTYIGVRNSRIVLADWDGVRALTTAAWLIQLGGYEVFVYAPDASSPLETGPERLRVLRSAPDAAPWIEAGSLHSLLQAGTAVVFDVDNSLEYRKQHIPGAYFTSPERAGEFVAKLGEGRAVVITSADGILAQSVASSLQGNGRDIRALLGGNRNWRRFGLPVESGIERRLTGEEDVYYGPWAYDGEEGLARKRRYLDWEIGLTQQAQRDEENRFKLAF
jgi:rhodanese-related sulfurtransferase